LKAAEVKYQWMPKEKMDFTIIMGSSYDFKK
jgi:hypothetical protein